VKPCTINEAIEKKKPRTPGHSVKVRDRGDIVCSSLLIKREIPRLLLTVHPSLFIFLGFIKYIFTQM